MQGSRRCGLKRVIKSPDSLMDVDIIYIYIFSKIKNGIL